jgi:hypothetical protein
MKRKKPIFGEDFHIETPGGVVRMKSSDKDYAQKYRLYYGAPRKGNRWTPTKPIRTVRGSRAWAWNLLGSSPVIGVWVNKSPAIGGGWEVMISLKVPKNFPTQLEALAYARNYMRRHPNG